MLAFSLIDDGQPLAVHAGMMKHLALAAALLAFAGTAAEAQGKGNKNKGQRGKQKVEKRVPPGHMPPAGLCRVWYDGVPPGRQPRPTDCNEAERVASRSDDARVIYGSRNGRRATRGQGAGGGIYERYPGDARYPSGTRYPDDTRTDRRRPTDDGRRTGGVAIPRAGRTLSGAASQNGYRDGLEKGREDADDRDAYDPGRHSWYRSADRGYESRLGTKDDYREQYRRAFIAGYDEAYRR